MFGAVCVLLLAAVHVNGNGMLIDPPNRSSMWRFGFDTPPNYEDNRIFCGGREVQYFENDGQCGACGDNWALPRPRENEHGGTYGLGVIAKTYFAGEIMNTVTRLTANHDGWFEWRLCVLDDVNGIETEACFNQHLLPVGNGTTTRYYLPNSNTADFPVEVHLPEGIQCQRCVLQWHYHTANYWGECPDGSSGLGCGFQENYKNCADITISSGPPTESNIYKNNN